MFLVKIHVRIGVSCIYNKITAFRLKKTPMNMNVFFKIHVLTKKHIQYMKIHVCLKNTWKNRKMNVRTKIKFHENAFLYKNEKICSYEKTWTWKCMFIWKWKYNFVWIHMKMHIRMKMEIHVRMNDEKICSKWKYIKDIFVWK